jgi:hypothetical protein
MLAGVDPAATAVELPDARRREQDRQRIMRSAAQPAPAGAGTPRRSPVRRRAVLAGALALGAVVTSVVVPRLGGQPDAPILGSTGGREGDVVRSAPALLLAAAARTETAAPATVGRYWLAERKSGGLVQVGPAANRYVVRVSNRHDLWLSTVPADRSGLVDQHLGAAPATGADEAAWKRDGSPSRWVLDPRSRREYTLTAAAGKLRADLLYTDFGWSFETGARSMKVKDMLAMPTEPAALRRELLALRPAEADADDPTWLYKAGMQLLMGLPVPPKVRAAAYRILSDLPGMRALGPMEDPSGRLGETIARIDRSPLTERTGPVEEILVFDPKTGTALATMRRLLQPQGTAAWAKPGTIISYEILTNAGWTAATPPRSG